MIKSKLSILRRSRKIEFWYDNEFFIYEKRQDKKQVSEFIWNADNEKVYGPLINDSTEEGEKIYKVLKRRIDKEKF